MSKEFENWVKSQSSEAIEARIARQIKPMKTANDNFKALKVELTARINDENNPYTCTILKVEGGDKTRVDTMNAKALAEVADWVKAHADDKEFLSKVASVAMLKDQTGKSEAELIEAGLCCISREQYTFKLPKKA